MAVIVLILVVLNTYPVLVSQRFVYQSKQSSMSTQALLIASTLAGLDTLTTETVASIMGTLEDQGSTRLMITNKAGVVVYDTSIYDPTVGQYALFQELYDALQGNDVFRARFAQRAFQSKVAVPVYGLSGITGAVYIVEVDAAQASLLLRFQSDIANLSIGVATVVMLISIVVSSALTRRVAELLRAIRKIREGEYDHVVPVHGKDELAELAAAFNELTQRLETTERLRRQFVSDASHELKTPLTSIRLLTDSILLVEDMPLPDVREFVGDIGMEIDRLTRLAEKLLSLTKLDARVPQKLQSMDVAPVLQRVKHMLVPLAEQAQVSIRCELAAGCIVSAQPDDMYQIFFNVMENAIKYNHPNGEVNIYLFAQEDTVCIHVDDTGVGIPEEELPRLFDRFYRVDKARAREAGGAGLGLSIVHHMVTQNKGRILFKSKIDEGTRVTLQFPLVRE